MEKMKAEIEEAIKKNLSSEVGELLKKELKELEELRHYKVDAEQCLKRLRSSEGDLKAEVYGLNGKVASFEERESVLLGREKAVIEVATEQRIRSAVMDEKENHHTTMVDTIKEMYKIPFQNRVLRENLLTSKPTQILQPTGRFNNTTNSYEEEVLSINEPTTDSKTITES
jgi:hypothetical protein